MKRLFFLGALLLGFATVYAQFSAEGDIESPVEWKGSVEQISEGTYNLVFEAAIEEGWHIFSQHTPEGGSMPLEVNYLDNGTSYQTNGETKESPTKRQFNDVFEVDEIIWENTAKLTQQINLKSPDTRYVKAELMYQVCEEVCINEEYYFVFDLKEKSATLYENYDDFKAFDTKVSAASQLDTQQDEAITTSTLSDPLNSSFSSAANFGSQDLKSPVKWQGEIKKGTEGKLDLVFKAEIDKGWHIFSQHTPEGGSLPLEIKYLGDGEDYKTEGETEESPTKQQFNDVFGVDEIIWENEAILTQPITLNNLDTRYIKAELAYQVCEELCINEEYYFVFDLKHNTVEVYSNYDDFEAIGTNAMAQQHSQTSLVQEASDKNTSKATNEGMWLIFISAFLWGFAALLTPCVFPMIPMTVSYFTKQSKTPAVGKRNAILYGLSIVVIYVLLGSLIVGIFGASSLNELSTNVTFNVIFFFVLALFGISFLGAFEIVLPSSWANKVDRMSDKGGLIGIFFMALALAIVSFSCTGPIIGTLLVQAASQGGIAPIIGMLGFSLAIAIPFGLFALFPGWMNSLPKSGGWLNSVKVVLGLLELALAFKFLSNADLVVHMGSGQVGFLSREIFLAIWIAIFGMMAFYLFGKIQLPNDSKSQHISVGRFMMGLLALSFTIYLIPGIWGAPLKMLSGYLPPEQYSESPYGIGYAQNANIQLNTDMPESAIAGPQNILAFRDYDHGLAYAKKIGKPIMLDFTGAACVNCRKMEDRIWSDKQVKSILENEVVLVSLYVDIDDKLPEDQQYTSEVTGRRIRTVGNKWSDFQIKNYKVNAQPYYVLVNPYNEQDLNTPVGYVPDVEKYSAWLKEGIGAFDVYASDQEENNISISVSPN